MYIKKTLINYFKYYVTLCDLVIDIRYIYYNISIITIILLYHYTRYIISTTIIIIIILLRVSLV